METKTDRNCRVQKLYDELMAEGKHGHYETMFLVVRLEVEAERDACALACDSWRSGCDNRTMQAEAWAAAECAKAIRERSNV